MTSSTKEQTYFLSKLLNQGGCLSCLNKRCLIKEQHGIPFPDKFCNYIKYPTNVSDIKNSIEKENIDLEGKTPIYTICNYINKVCKNCEEGRYKRIKLNNKNFVICFNVIKNDRITFGIHIDLKLVLKGTQFDVIALPYDMKIKKTEISIKDAMILLLDKEKSLIKSVVQKESEVNKEILLEENYDINQDVQLTESIVTAKIVNETSLCTEDNNQNETKENSKKKNINLDSSLFSGTNVKEEDFPALSRSSIQLKKISPKTIDYSQINKSLKNDIVEKENLEKKKNEYIEKIKTEKESKTKMSIVESNLNKKIIELELKIRQLEEEIKKNNFKYQTYIDNKDIYDEIYFNKNKINSIVYETFYSTNYEDYVIL